MGYAAAGRYGVAVRMMVLGGLPLMAINIVSGLFFAGGLLLVTPWMRARFRRELQWGCNYVSTWLAGGLVSALTGRASQDSAILAYLCAKRCLGLGWFSS